MARPHDIPDGSDEKWQYTEHTAAKHEILRRYLGAWLAILGRRRKGSTFRHSRLVLVDGFAGRGRYLDGQLGSPAIMFEEAVRAVEADLAERVVIRCAEPNDVNFSIWRRYAPLCSTTASRSSRDAKRSVRWVQPLPTGPQSNTRQSRRL